MSWIRRQELQRRIKSYYSTQGEADICKGGGEGEEEEEEDGKEHSLTTEIYNGLHCKGESNTITQIHSYSPTHPGRFFYIFALEMAKEKTTIRHAPSFAITPISTY